MPLLIPNVEIKYTATAKGHGVFARQAFCVGDVVEACPVVVFHCPHRDLPRELQERVFDWSFLARVPEPDMQAIALGYGGMYNHANPASMRYEAATDNSIRMLRFVAVRGVSDGEELTVNYSGLGGVAQSDGNHWFDRLGIKPI